MANKIGHLRDAATIMVLAKSNFVAGEFFKNAHPSLLHSAIKFDYRVLVLKRTSRSKFLPNIYMFPGGVIHKTDFSPSWTSIINIKQNEIASIPPVFEKNKGYEISPSVAFKICAIRETFEESGVLLCANSQGGLIDMDELSKDDIIEWREKIHKDPSYFIKMCQHYGFHPSVQKTRLWANWMTPAHMDEAHGGTSRRFDTLFYLHGLPYAPEERHDDKEIVSSEWATPIELMYHYRKGNLTLGPPQVFELSRLCNFQSYNKLEAFAEHRENEGAIRYLGIRIDSKDGHILALPGDELYPDDPIASEQCGPPTIDKTSSESCAAALNLNRLCFSDVKNIGNNTVQSSAGSECGHRLPLSESVIFKDINMTE